MTGPTLASILAAALKARGVDAAIVVDGPADAVIAGLVAAGWTVEENVDVAAGKRVRYLHPPEPTP